MFNVQFNAGESREAIRRAIAALEDMTPLFQDVAEYMTEATRQRFVTGTAPDGSKWPAKSQVTLDRYKRLGYGNLSRVLIGPGKRLSREIVSEATKGGAVIGSALIYSSVMQDGAPRGAFGTNSRGRPIPWGAIPARTWLGISSTDADQIVAIAEEHIAASVDGAEKGR
ncbi:MAG TPA: phage virion morphogenesis protein [Novosphingobium sp.]|nr:phage virion morphogenesis protein [Novosphingobium sp.]